MKAAESLVASLVADLQAAEVAQPSHGPLDHVARLTEPAAVRTPTHRQQAANHPPHQQLDDVREAVGPVALQDLRLPPHLPVPAAQRRELLKHRLRPFFRPPGWRAPRGGPPPNATPRT